MAHIAIQVGINLLVFGPPVVIVAWWWGRNGAPWER
jgi:hypothetical protein